MLNHQTKLVQVAETSQAKAAKATSRWINASEKHYTEDSDALTCLLIVLHSVLALIPVQPLCPAMAWLHLPCSPCAFEIF